MGKGVSQGLEDLVASQTFRNVSVCVLLCVC